MQRVCYQSINLALGAPTPLFWPYCSNEWYCNMDRGLYNPVIFLDLQKAFDTVNHVFLLGRLEACGIRDDALNLFASYLADRKQTCQVNGKQSGLRSISCGIP